MSDHIYKYDVAFSFLDEDEELVIQINNLIQDRMATFIYSRRQGELAGTDGEETLNRVFGSEARTVVVLHRKNWGQTPWTRIEETAMRNRAYEEGYDFVLFVPLDKPPVLPKWLPKNRIWVGLDRWGIDGAATVIESRVQEEGGTSREETIEEHTARLSREIAVAEEKRAILSSERGIQAANNEVADLFSELKRVVNNISGNDLTVKLAIEVGQRECVIQGHGFSLHFRWSVQFLNSLQDSALYLRLWEGAVTISGSRSIAFEKPKKLEELVFDFDLSSAGKPIWRETSGEERSYSTRELQKLAMTMLLEKIRDSKAPQK
jgi:hypothetical protein